MTLTTATEAYCRCGSRRYASEREASKVEWHGGLKCPDCGTFATDHTYWPAGDDGLRCMDCDARPWSHR